MKKQNFPSHANSRLTIIEATPMPKAGEVFPTLKEFKMFTSPLPPVRNSSTTSFITTTTLPTTTKIHKPKTPTTASVKQIDTSTQRADPATRLLPPSLIMMRKRPNVMPGRWNHRTIKKPPQIESDTIIKTNTENSSKASQSNTQT